MMKKCEKSAGNLSYFNHFSYVRKTNNFCTANIFGTTSWYTFSLSDNVMNKDLMHDK